MATIKSSNINITDLDFEDVSQSLKEYLKGQTILKDYNFEGSNLSILIDLLAYAAHTSAFNANMVASEGKIVIIPIILIFFIGIFINHLIDDSLSWLKYFNYFSFSFLLFTLYFFRNPKRKPVGTSNQMVSPADGKVIQIINVDDPDISNAKQISIFLSIFNVHSQYVPIDSSVISSNYFSGKYLLAFNHKASSKNEQSTTLFKTKENNKYKIKQIAGFIARRILNYMESDQSVIKGQRLGFIRFGSRVEIIVSSNNFDIIVKKGDKIKANISTIGIFK